MARTRKSAKRSTRKKQSGAKRTTAKNTAVRKSAPRRAAKRSGSKSKRTARTGGLKRQARKGLQAARGGIETVRQVGDKAWETLKSTTAQVVEGVKETLTRENGQSREQSSSSADRF